MNINLDTIIIFVSDVDKLKFFYVDLLELKIAEEIPSQWLLLRAGNAKVGIHKIGNQYQHIANPGPRSESNVKIAFEIDQDLTKFREYLISKEVAMREIKSFGNDGYLYCDGEDPEGNVFQLKQRVS